MGDQVTRKSTEAEGGIPLHWSPHRRFLLVTAREETIYADAVTQSVRGHTFQVGHGERSDSISSEGSTYDLVELRVYIDGQQLAIRGHGVLASDRENCENNLTDSALTVGNVLRAPARWVANGRGKRV
jgi:hypothetical protein